MILVAWHYIACVLSNRCPHRHIRVSRHIVKKNKTKTTTTTKNLNQQNQIQDTPSLESSKEKIHNKVLLTTLKARQLAHGPRFPYLQNGNKRIHFLGSGNLASSQTVGMQQELHLCTALLLPS